jgi:DnaJ-domain-containing protein 1
MLCHRRLFSSGTLAGVEAVPFRFSPSDATQALAAWHTGLSPLSLTVRACTPVYLPFWSFSTRLRFSNTWLQGQPALQVYSGALVPSRAVASAALLSPIADAVPWGTHLLQLPGRATVVEPFALPESSAWALAQVAFANTRTEPGVKHAQVESRKVLHPAFIVRYTLLGLEMSAYVNGGSGAVWGTAQEVAGARLFSLWRTGIQLGGLAKGGTLGLLLELLARINPQLAKGLLLAASALLRISFRIIFTPPFLLGLFGLMGHTLLYPRYAQWAMEQAWLAQRAAEAAMQAGRGEEDAWVFRGREAASAPRGFGPTGTGSARAPGGPGSASSRRGRMPPPVKPGDYHGILGVKPGATKEELSAAFRRQLQLYHPDHAEAGGWDTQGASQRTQEIIEAYKELRRGGVR